MLTCCICNQTNRPNAKFCAHCRAPLFLQDKYRITQLLGRGGFGAVYRAEQLHLGGAVCAIKEQGLEANADPAQNQVASEQFRKEAEILQRLSQIHLPKVIAFFAEANRDYLVMEFIEGETLEKRLKNAGKPFSEAQVIAWGKDLCEVLNYLHTQSMPVIHRDVKPANIKIKPDQTLVLIDFGIAKHLLNGVGTEPGARAVSEPYSPAEQYGSSSGTDARSDIYALGITLYELVTGLQPPTALDRMQKPTTPPRQINPTISTQLETVILKAIELPPTKRFQSAREMGAAFPGQLPIPTITPLPTPSAHTWQSRIKPYVTYARTQRMPLWLAVLAIFVLLCAQLGLSVWMSTTIQSTQTVAQTQSAMLTRANQTATSQANNLANAQSTIGAQTVTIADMQRTATAQAQMLPTVGAYQSQLSTIALRATVMPAENTEYYLPHGDGKQVSYKFIKDSRGNYIAARNLIIEADCFNPFDRATQDWDYGFFFRSTNNNEFRLYVTSEGTRWELTSWMNGIGESVEQGKLSNLNLAADGRNFLRLVVEEDMAILLLNNQYVTSINLKNSVNFSKLDRGNLGLITGSYGASHLRKDYATRCIRFGVWSLPDAR